MSWHYDDCAVIAIQWEDGYPSCGNCGRRAIKLTTEGYKPLPPPRPPPDTPRFQLHLQWPDGMKYAKELNPDQHQKLLESVESLEPTWSATKLPPSEAPTPSTPEDQALEVLPGIHVSTSSWSRIYEDIPQDEFGGGFRVLRLHGSERLEDPIHGSLEIHDVSGVMSPVFEALSYTWADASGNADLCEPIFIGPQYDVLPVTRNCLSALRRMRAKVDRLIWVDAICINQLNVAERGKQVGIMGRIYREAARVLIYLGEPNIQSESISEFETDEGRHRLLQKPYFSRVWVVQEVRAAFRATVTYGAQTKHLSWLQDHNMHVPWLKGRSESLFQLLEDTRQCRCGDPRDKIFGIMGLVGDEALDLSIDYSLSVQQLYTGLTAYFLTSSPIPPVVHMLGVPKLTRNLPSWVPDWNNLPPHPVWVNISMKDLFGPPPSCIHEPRAFFELKRTQISTQWALPSYQDRKRLFPQKTRRLAVTSNGSLELDAYSVFRYSRDQLVFNGVPDKPFDMSECEITPSTRKSNNAESLHFYYVPALSRICLLQQLAPDVWSYRGQCLVREQLRMIEGDYTPYDYEDRSKRLTLVEQLAFDAYLTAGFFLEKRLSPWIEFDVEDYSPLWPGPYYRWRSHDKDPNNTKCNDDEFRAMARIRDEICEIFRSEGFDLHSDRFCAPETGVAHLSAEFLRPGHLLTRQKYLAVPNSELDDDLERCIPTWQISVQKLKEYIDKYQCTAEALKDLEETIAKLRWKSPTVDQVHPVLEFLLSRFVLRSKYGFPHTTISGAFLLHEAFKFIAHRPLHIDRPRDWNRDRLWWHIATLQLLADMQEPIRQRQIAWRFEESKKHVKRITIV